MMVNIYIQTSAKSPKRQDARAIYTIETMTSKGSADRTWLEEIEGTANEVEVIGVILLFILLCVHILKVDHIREKSDFLLENMAFFFIPAGVSIINYFDVLKNWVVQLIVICVVSTVVTFAVTAYSMKFVLYLMQKKKSGRAKE